VRCHGITSANCTVEQDNEPLTVVIGEVYQVQTRLIGVNGQRLIFGENVEFTISTGGCQAHPADSSLALKEFCSRKAVSSKSADLRLSLANPSVLMPSGCGVSGSPSQKAIGCIAEISVCPSGESDAFPTINYFMSTQRPNETMQLLPVNGSYLLWPRWHDQDTFLAHAHRAWLDVRLHYITHPSSQATWKPADIDHFTTSAGIVASPPLAFISPWTLRMKVVTMADGTKSRLPHIIAAVDPMGRKSLTFPLRMHNAKRCAVKEEEQESERVDCNDLAYTAVGGRQVRSTAADVRVKLDHEYSPVTVGLDGMVSVNEAGSAVVTVRSESDPYNGAAIAITAAPPRALFFTASKADLLVHEFAVVALSASNEEGQEFDLCGQIGSIATWQLQVNSAVNFVMRQGI
jgi:hypothetical protein